jgi:tetratricopeptide (TPR) repeat protein
MAPPPLSSTSLSRNSALRIPISSEDDPHGGAGIPEENFAMAHSHLDDATLNELLRLNDHRVQKDVLLHLLAACPECGRVGAHLLEAARAGLLPRDYSALEAELARSRAGAAALWKRLERLSFEKQLGVVREMDRFLSWGLCELLCRMSREAAPQDATRAVERAELALLVAERLRPGQPAEEEWLLGLRALAWAHLGNARRVLGELRGAAEAFARSAELWEKAEKETGDPLGYGPVILDLEGSLRRGQRRFAEALDLLDRVVVAYRDGDPETRDLHLAGRALIKKAYTLDQMGEPGRALEVLREAAPLVDPARDPRLPLCLRHNILDTLSKIGRFQEARELLPEVAALSREIGNALDLARLRWAEARIAAGLGEAAGAEEAFEEVRRELLAQGIGYDAALVSLELAALYAGQGRTEEMKELAGEMLPIFQAADVHREALAALAVFQQAAAREAATLDLVKEVAAFLERARHDPGLRFGGK